MEVIRQPKRIILTKDPLYEVECHIDSSGLQRKGCGALMRVRLSEVNKIIDQRDGDAMYIICPCCGKTIWKNNFNFKLVKEDDNTDLGQ